MDLSSSGWTPQNGSGFPFGFPFKTTRPWELPGESKANLLDLLAKAHVGFPILVKVPKR